jgi:methylamine--corrinoid protein Co-methyltransferase
MAIDPIDLYLRLTKGERMAETGFDRLLITEVGSKLKKYGIEYDPTGDIIPTDETLLDAIWNAAYELAIEVGFYCKDTGRRILLSEEEIKGAIVEMRTYQSLRQCPYRGLDDPRPVPLIAGPFGAPAQEDIYLPLCISYVQEPGMIGLATPSLISYRGSLGKAGTPAEIMTIRKEVMWAKEALERVNKKDLFIIPAPQRSLSMATVLNINRSEPICILFEPHLKMSMDNMLYYTLLFSSDMLYVGSSQVDYIGIHGGPEATLLIMLAELLMGLGIMGASEGSTSGIGALVRGRVNLGGVHRWGRSLISQISSRQGLRFYSGVGVSRTGTSRTLAGIAIGMIIALACGDSCAHVGVSGIESYSGLDYRFGFEVNMGMAGVTRKEANELLPQILIYARNQEVPSHAPKFEDCYDLDTVQPKKEWTDLYNRTKEDLKAIGVRFADVRDYK